MHKRPQGLEKLARWLMPAATLVLFGCPNEDLAPLEPCTVSGASDEITQSGVDKVDLLFVIDDSPSMKEEQANLSTQLPRLVQILATGDFEGDGMQDFQPVSSLNLGVINVNMGANGVGNIKNCGGFGSDGILLSKINPADPNCAGLTNVPIYQQYMPPQNTADRATAAAAVAKTFACVANVGTEGCGFEQQLEAMWKAVAPSKVADFSRGTRGHGDAENKGFLREDAVLAVIQVSDEEDCSIQDGARELFVLQTSDARFQGQGFNLRCGLHAEEDDVMWPVSRYIDGLKSLKASNPDRVIFAGIVGIPQQAEAQTFDEILARPDMKYMPDGDIASDKTVGKPACETERGRADPARRFVKVAQGFGENGIVRSICAADFKSALDAILKKISKQLTGACLPRALNPNEEGIVECDVVEILARDDNKCDAAKGRVFLETREVSVGDSKEKRTVCKINQVAVKSGALMASPAPLEGVSDPLVGWYYDNFSEDVTKGCPKGSQQRIAFTPGADLATGAKASFECFQPVARIDMNAIGKDAVNYPCGVDNAPNAGICMGKSDPKGYQLTCDENTLTCQIVCQRDSQCPDSWVCNRVAGNDTGLCVNPTCPPPNN